jgi:hypothetical protein
MRAAGSSHGCQEIEKEMLAYLDTRDKKPRRFVFCVERQC